MSLDVQKNIKEAIEKNNKTIEILLSKSTFVLNKEIQRLNDQNTQLIQQCEHEFVDGMCKWCGVPEEFWNNEYRV